MSTHVALTIEGERGRWHRLGQALGELSLQRSRGGNSIFRRGAADLRGKGDRIRTVAVPVWVKQGVNAWLGAAKMEEGRLLRAVSKAGKLRGDGLSDWAIWSVVEQSAKQIGIECFGAHDLRRTCAKLCRKAGGDLERSSSCSGTPRSRPRSGILGQSRRSRWLQTTTSVSKRRSRKS